MSGDSTAFPILEPNLQISFFYKLQVLRSRYLYEALGSTVQSLDIRAVDEQLASFVRIEALQKVARFGIRGEVFFPVPHVIQANPHLLGYYRLLYGFSQKSFYQQGPFGRFKGVEERGEIRRQIRGDIDSLCRSLVGTGELLVSGLDTLSLSIVQDLQVITIGSQLRGFQNTEIGQDATKEVFELLKSIVSPYITSSTNTTITIRNNTNRTVLIEFRSDPDIGIIETLTTEDRKLIAMEIKGGTDISNVWNRLGEAEKSHSDAKREGFLEFWTILGVDINPSDGRRRSPTTNRFFYLHRIKDLNTEEHKRFRELLGSIMSIPT